MDVIVDRRQQPKGKNLGNRQRFVRRARAQIRGANFARRGIARPADIYPVFRDLFRRSGVDA